MISVTSEFDQGERSQAELLRGSLEDAQDQLRRARQRLERSQRRVKNLEVAVESWALLLAQYEHARDHGPERFRPDHARV